MLITIEPVVARSTLDQVMAGVAVNGVDAVLAANRVLILVAI